MAKSSITAMARTKGRAEYLRRRGRTAGGEDKVALMVRASSARSKHLQSSRMRRVPAKVYVDIARRLRIRSDIGCGLREVQMVADDGVW